MRHIHDNFTTKHFQSALFWGLSFLFCRLDKSKTLHSHRGPRGLIGLNQQLFDMGVPAKKLFDVNKAYSIASKVIERFDLVLVYEHFEESMVLMADMFCWPLDFVAGIKHNVLPLSYKVLFEIIRLRKLMCCTISLLK